LQDADVSRQMCLGMLTPSIARVVKHRRRRVGSAKGSVVAQVNPASPSVGFPLGQNRNRRIVPMQALGRHDMGFHKASDGIKRRANRPHGVGHGRQGDWHAFQSVALGLAVQGLMLTELLEYDHGQEAGPRPAPGDDKGMAPALA
jgi:hypothetical protein